MKVLVVGSGGREHSLVWKLSQDEMVRQIYAAPGNGGLAALAECVPIGAEDMRGLLSFARESAIDLTVVGPEAPLATGIVDLFQAEGLRVFGPTKSAAEIESSKAFARDFMAQMGIPAPIYRVFSDYQEARRHLASQPVPIVVKADGLAAGKGSIVCSSQEEAQQALERIMVERVFGAAGQKVVIEECLEGEEVSILAFSDGTHVVPMLAAQDHKPVYDGDRGPNTGGMGCYAPAPIATPELVAETMDRVLLPTIQGMAELGRPYKGALDAGLMVTAEGLKVLEFNCRFGDPENQVIMPLLEGSLLEILEACIDGCLDKVRVSWKDEACVCVVLASGGYPGSYQTGLEIKGLEKLAGEEDIVAFHAGTALKDGKPVTAGGRVMGVTSVAPTIQEAIERAYQGVAKVSFSGMHYRTDIGAKALRREG